MSDHLPFPESNFSSYNIILSLSPLQLVPLDAAQVGHAGLNARRDLFNNII